METNVDRQEQNERVVSRIAQSVYLTLFQRFATIVGLPCAAFVAIHMINKIDTSIDATLKMQGKLDTLVDTIHSQDSRIGRLETALFFTHDAPVVQQRIKP